MAPTPAKYATMPAIPCDRTHQKPFIPQCFFGGWLIGAFWRNCLGLCAQKHRITFSLSLWVNTSKRSDIRVRLQIGLEQRSSKEAEYFPLLMCASPITTRRFRVASEDEPAPQLLFHLVRQCFVGVITEKSRTLSLLETNAADDVAGYLRAAFGDPLYCCNSISVVFTGLAGWLCESDRRQEEHWHTLPLYFFG